MGADPVGDGVCAGSSARDAACGVVGEGLLEEGEVGIDRGFPST